MNANSTAYNNIIVITFKQLYKKLKRLALLSIFTLSTLQIKKYLAQTELQRERWHFRKQNGDKKYIIKNLLHPTPPTIRTSLDPQWAIARSETEN